MNVIDLEILIPASPEFIWRFMGDLAAIPQWYEDVVSISFLSTQREGRGTRWRHSTARGNDVIVEVSAWYDTLGYEYRVVGSTSFNENQGRLRLHEVTDGTLVRWTFQYEPGGVLGGIRNAMRLKRSTTNQIQDSLRNLHQLIMQESGGISTHEAKASMQDAPDVEERLSYQPRHPSAFHEEELEAPGDATSLSERIPLSYELELEAEVDSPVVDSDTKPNPVVLGADAGLIPDIEAESKLDDTRPIEVEALLAEIQPPAIARPEPAAEPEPEERPAPEPIDKPQRSRARVAKERASDSSQLSVFEIFGLQKPSEARVLAQTEDKAVNERAGEAAGRDRLPAPIVDARALDAKDKAPETGQVQAPDQGASDGMIAGWRRSARRRKAPIRSNT